MNRDLQPAVDFIESVKPVTMREKFAKERALEALRGADESDTAAEDAYRQFKNLEEVAAAIDSGAMSVETALMLERNTKNRVTYVRFLEDRIEEGDEG